MSKDKMRNLLGKNPKQDKVMEKYTGLLDDIKKETGDVDALFKEYKELKKQVDKIVKERGD